MNQSRLIIVPSSIRDACDYVAEFHRHHKPPQGAKFAICVQDSDAKVRGVAIVGRPVSRMLDDGLTAEVTRLCTDGCKNACSALYAACWRICREMGYRKLITYILDTEPGTSLRAAGWKCVGQRGGGKWSRLSRVRTDEHPTQQKTLWEVTA